MNIKALRQSKFIAWGLWVGWTILLCILMLLPSSGGRWNLSILPDWGDLIDSSGHVILIGIEYILLYHLLRFYLSTRRAEQVAIVVSLMLGVGLEFAQLFVPARGLALIDIAAAFVGVGIGMWLMRRMR